MPALDVTPAPTPDPLDAALATDLRRQLRMEPVSVPRQAIYTRWLAAHPNY